MTESKSQEKLFPYGMNLKQEGTFDSFNWAPIENDFEDLRNSNSFLLGKINTRGPPLFTDFNPISGNLDMNNDQMLLNGQNENQNTSNDPIDTGTRLTSNYPLFNEKLLNNNSTSSEVGINSIKPGYSSLMMTSINKLQNFPVAAPSNYYFPFNSNNLRRPLPQELLEEEPVYVNPKQTRYERIMKLRIKKAQRGMVKSTVVPLDRPKDKSYKHLSRHLHAKRRERGTGGRFLSKEEAQKKKHETQPEEGGMNSADGFDTVPKGSISDE